MENLLKLKNFAGLNIPPAKKGWVSQRMIVDMKSVLKNPESAKTNDVYYTVYRNLDVLLGKLRYDITVIPQTILGEEFSKTFGHYHEGAYPELYEVLAGQAYFLLQRYDKDPAEIEEAYVVEASAGEKAIMLPGFGHLSVNVSDRSPTSIKTDLVLANWIGLVKYDYNLIQKLHGGCYYVLLARRSLSEGGDRSGAIEFEKNQNYKSVPELKKLKLRDLPELGIKNDKSHPIWYLRSRPEKLEWLIKPEEYKELLTIEKLYKEI